MARKQNDYLAGLLAPQEAAKTDESSVLTQSNLPTLNSQPAASSRAGLSLLGRENVLSRVASGEVRQVTQLQLNPGRVRVWAGNARIQSRLSQAAVQDLIDSILAEGGQKVPVIVRRVADDPDFDFEVVAGTRRHFAISWLRGNSYPDMKLLAQVADLDDEAAFRLADIENRARKDVSDIERARNYAAALHSHYDGKAVRMAERLKVSKSWISKMLKAASIPDSVLATFANLGELSLNPAYALATALDDKGRSKAILNEAKAITAENQVLIERGASPLPGSTVHRRLMAVTAAPIAPPPNLRLEIAGSHGRPILAVKSITRQGVTIHLAKGGGASDEELRQALQTVLEGLRENGVSLT